jgi:hypothetical protein
MAAAQRDVPNAIVLLDKFEKAQLQKLPRAALRSGPRNRTTNRTWAEPILGLFQGL